MSDNEQKDPSVISNIKPVRIKLDDLEDPKFEVETKEGDIRVYDPIELATKLEKLDDPKLVNKTGEKVKIIKEALGIDDISGMRCFQVIELLGNMLDIDIEKKTQSTDVVDSSDSTQESL